MYNSACTSGKHGLLYENENMTFDINYIKKKQEYAPVSQKYN